MIAGTGATSIVAVCAAFARDFEGLRTTDAFASVDATSAATLDDSARVVAVGADFAAVVCFAVVVEDFVGVVFVVVFAAFFVVAVATTFVAAFAAG